MAVNIEVKDVQAVNANTLPEATGNSFTLLGMVNGAMSRIAPSLIEDMLSNYGRIFPTNTETAEVEDGMLPLRDENLKNGLLIVPSTPIKGFSYEGNFKTCHLYVFFSGLEDTQMTVDGITTYVNQAELSAGGFYYADITIMDGSTQAAVIILTQLQNLN